MVGIFIRGRQLRYSKFAIGEPLESPYDLLAFDESAKHSLQRYISFPGAHLSTFELDPSFIEAIEHPNARRGIPHTLRFEKRLPRLVRYSLDSDRTGEQAGKG
jgi:hypothetical protein